MNKLSQRKQNKDFAKNTPKLSCVSCRKIFGVNNFTKHTPQRCGYWRRKAGLEKRVAWNKGLTKDTSPIVKKIGETIKEQYATGKRKVRRSSDAKIRYRQACSFRFNVFDYPELFDLTLLEKHGWYHPVTNPDGVSRDHIISVDYGWRKNIDPSIISHVMNCQLMIHKDNNKKNTRSDLLLSELLTRIDRVVM